MSKEGFYVQIPSKEGNDKIQIAAYADGYRWINNATVPFYGPDVGDYIRFRYDNKTIAFIHQQDYSKSNINSIYEEKSWAFAQGYFNFDDKIDNLCKCDSRVLFWQGCLCKGK